MRRKARQEYASSNWSTIIRLMMRWTISGLVIPASIPCSSWSCSYCMGFIVSFFSCVLRFRDLSCIHYYFDTMKMPFVFVAFYVVVKGQEFAWMQEAEVLVVNLLFGLR